MDSPPGARTGSRRKAALSLHPDVTADIRTIHHLKGNSPDGRASSSLYSFLDELISIMQQTVPFMSENDAILCSWGIYVEAVYASAAARTSVSKSAALRRGL